MTLAEIVNTALQVAREEITQELIAQGHNNTGELIKSIDSRISLIEDGVRGELLMLERYRFVQFRTPPEKIPFSGRTGKGGTSKYIQGLIQYFKSKGVEHPVRAAFATAHKHRKEGRPTRGSYLFASNGRRTGFLEASLAQIENKVYAQLEKDVTNFVELTIAA